MKPNLIAPCGINCALCLGYLRDKNKCPGCRMSEVGKPESRYHCIVKMCPHFSTGKSKYCYDSPKFPCRRIKDLDKRYKTKYNYSPIEALLTIKEKGVKQFLEEQRHEWICPNCRGTICMHRGKCLKRIKINNNK